MDAAMSYEGASHVYSLKIINYTNILFWQNLEIEVTYANPQPPPPPTTTTTNPTHTHCARQLSSQAMENT